MAAGDPVTQSVSVSGGGTSTITVPSGEVWVVSQAAWSTTGSNSAFLEMTDSTGTVLIRDVAPDKPFRGRPVFDDSHDPQLNNTSCSTETMSIFGREV